MFNKGFGMGNIFCRLFWLWKSWCTVAGSVAGTIWLWLWGVKLHGAVKCVGIPRIERSAAGRIELGHGVCLRSARCSNIAGVTQKVSLGTLDGGVLTLGDGCGISGAVLVAGQRIEIGNNVWIGVGCRIYDCDFHPLDAAARLSGGRGKTAPVVIGDNVWLAADVIVLKGVTIGENTVVAAGSVVTKPLGANVLAGGNPARVIRSLAELK